MPSPSLASRIPRTITTSHARTFGQAPDDPPASGERRQYQGLEHSPGWRDPSTRRAADGDEDSIRLQDTPAPDDIVLSKGDATVLIDSLSLEFMGGAEIDYVDDLIGQSFQIKNPNAVAGCGCGTSFSVAS